MSSKIGPFLVFPLVKTPLSVYYKMLVIGTHLTVAKLWKTGIPKNYSPYCTIGCINFNFFGNIKNRQPAYASLGSLEDQIFFFFAPKTKFSWPPKVWYFWKIPQSLLVIFSSFLFLRKVQERTENTKIN